MKLSIHFSLAPGKASDLPIRMRVSYDGLRLDLRTGFVCPRDRWDASMMRVRAGSVNRYGEKASVINRALSKEESVVGDILARYELDGLVPEPSVLKSDFDAAMGRKPSKAKGGGSSAGAACTVGDVFVQFLRDYGSTQSVQPRTVQGYETVLVHVRSLGLADVAMSKLSMKDLSDFVVGMRDLGIENNSVMLYLARMKTVLKWARKSGLYSGTLPEDFSPKLKTAKTREVHYLEWEEFERILNVPLDLPRLRSVRDAFCFCCATGLRVSDCEKLRWSDLHLEADVPFLLVLVKKTQKPVKIELNKWSRMVLDRQPRPESGADDGLVFQSFRIAYRNEKLSVIARAAGISGQVQELSYVGNSCKMSLVDKADAITTHWARHTFVVHALSLGIPPDVVMSWTGHSSYQTMRPYIAITDRTKAEKMGLFDL